MSKCDLDRQTPLCRSDIDDRIVFLPGELFGERLRHRQGASRHPLGEPLQRASVSIESRIMSRAAFAALRAACSNRFRQEAPMGKDVTAVILQLSTDIARLVAIQIE